MSIFFSLKNRLSPMFCFGNANIGLSSFLQKNIDFFLVVKLESEVATPSFATASTRRAT